MTHWRSYPRTPTPPPIKRPIVDNDNDIDDDENNKRDFGWFYSANAGGMVLNFGKHRGQMIHDASISYLYWCYRTFEYDHPVLKAFRIYHAGLEEYAKTEYGDFVVPFGWKHKGKMIRQCRDKKWLLWTMRQKVLTDKYTVFFIAVQHWLANPRHYEVTRDIGELLRCSEYSDGIDLSGGNTYDEEDPTLPDDEEDDDNDDEYDREGVPTQADLDFIDDGPVEDGVSSSNDSEEEEFEHGQDSTSKLLYHGLRSVNTAGPSSYDTRYPSRKKHKKKRSAESRNELDRDFIVPDDNDKVHDSEDYFTSDTEMNFESPTRVTRSAAKRLANEKRRKIPASPTASKTRKHLNSALLSSDEDRPKSSGSSPSKRPRRQMVVESDEDDEEEDDDDSLPSFDLSRYAKTVSGRKKKTKWQNMPGSDSEVEFVEPQDIFHARKHRPKSPNGSDGKEEDGEEEEEEIPSPAKRCKAMVAISPPESEGEQEEDDEEWWNTPVTPHSRFLNRKRVLTSDSEGDEAAASGVHSPCKKSRAKSNVSLEIEEEKEQDVFMTPAGKNRRTSHSTKGKRKVSALEVKYHAEGPSTPTKARLVHRQDVGSVSTSRDHHGTHTSSPLPSQRKSHRSQVTE